MSEGIFTSAFREACADIQYLYNRGYPARRIADLAGNRYRLSRVQRSVLRRGIVSEAAARERKLKLLGAEDIAGRNLSVDSCNVLAIVGNYLSGHFVYVSTDALVRDAAESRGIFRKDILRRRAVDLMFKALANLSPAGLICYIDAPLTHSRDMAAELREALLISGLDVEVQLVNSADRILKNAGGVLVTGDSEIVDSVNEVFDLSHYILDYEFSAELPDLAEFLK